jgi:hypothetical protein
MNGAYNNIKEIGAFVIWVSKGFKGSFKDCMKGHKGFYIGILLIILFVFIAPLMAPE